MQRKKEFLNPRRDSWAEKEVCACTDTSDNMEPDCSHYFYARSH